MKKLFYSVFVLAVIFVSCTSTEDSILTSGSLYESITAYVSDSYPDVTISKITTDGTTATATLSSGETVTFSTSGTVISYANNASQGVSADSLTLTTDTTSTDTISSGKHHHHHKGSHHKHGYKHDDSDLSVDSLSTTINDYISTNYSGYTLINAKTDTICEGIVTCVMVCDSTSGSEPLKLIFDTSGNFLMKSERIKYADVPETITAIITANYSEYTPASRSSLYTLADGSIQYKIYLKANKKVYWVRISSDGTVACENL
jgi:hypothetical protein